MATRGIFQRKKENLARSKEMQKKKENENSDDSLSYEYKDLADNNIDKLNDSSLLEKSNVTNSEFEVKDENEKNYEEYKSELDSILNYKKKKLEEAYKLDKDKYEEKLKKKKEEELKDIMEKEKLNLEKEMNEKKKI